MEITVQELGQSDSSSYQIIDMRSAEQIAHGRIKGAVEVLPDEISGNDKVGGIIGLLSNGTYSDNTNNGLVKSSSKESYDEIGSDTRA